MKFIVIGITDNPQPFFPSEVLEIIRQGRVFSGGKRHHEIVAPFLPVDAQWIDITVPLDDVFDNYSSLFTLHSLFSPVATPCSSASPTPSNARCLMLKSCSILRLILCRCWLTDW